MAHMNPLTEATLLERSVLDEGMRQMATWTPEEIVEILEEAATILVTLRAEVWCVQCNRPIKGEPVRDPETASWIAGAPTFCSTDCLAAYDERRMNRDENWS